jgi:hypothetical protein
MTRKINENSKTSKYQNKNPLKFTRRKTNTPSPPLVKIHTKKFKTPKMTRRKLKTPKLSNIKIKILQTS